MTAIVVGRASSPEGLCAGSAPDSRMDIRLLSMKQFHLKIPVIFAVLVELPMIPPKIFIMRAEGVIIGNLNMTDFNEYYRKH